MHARQMKYWQTETERAEPKCSERVVDLVFRVSGTELPIDHAWLLSESIRSALPWFETEPSTALHVMHGPASGNGWMRPADDEVLQLSRRARLTLRIPTTHIEQAKSLSGRTLVLDGWRLAVGTANLKPLHQSETLFCRHFPIGDDVDEEAALSSAAAQLESLGIEPRKLLCGQSHDIRTPHGAVRTCSLLLADMEPGQSIRLQETGLGQNTKLGCGVFIPHKSIAPVRTAAEE